MRHKLPLVGWVDRSGGAEPPVPAPTPDAPAPRPTAGAIASPRPLPTPGPRGLLHPPHTGGGIGGTIGTIGIRR
jgi:hypothetical protein